MRQMLLLVFVTSLFFLLNSAASEEEDSEAEFGFYPRNLEALEGALGTRRRNGLSLLEMLADYSSTGSGERNNFGELVQRSMQTAALEKPFWNRLFAKDIKESPVDAQVGAGASGVAKKISPRG